MVKANTRIIEKPRLSDWIVFLSDIVNRRQTYLGLIFSSFFSIVVLLFAVATLYVNYTSLAAFFAMNNIKLDASGMNLTIWIVCGGLLITYSLMLSLYLYQIGSKKSVYNRAKALLIKIMKRKISTVEDVEKEWFRDNTRYNNMEPKAKKGLITNSDWTSFLMNISSTYDNYLIGLGALIITGIFGAIEVNRWLNRPLLEALLIILFFLIVYLVSFGYIKRKRKQFEKLAEKIMLGDIEDLDEIKKEYKKIQGINVND